MRIRKARITDTESIAEYNARLAWETEERRLNLPRVRKGVAALLRDSKKGVYFVAEETGQVIGQILITLEWSDWRNGNFWWIQSVYVAEEFRQRGVFRALYAHVYRLARSRKSVCGLRLYVDEHNHRAQEAYERLGMNESNYKFFEVDFVLKAV